MPSLKSRAVQLGDGYARMRPEPSVPVAQQPLAQQPVVSMPTPLPQHLMRNAHMLSSLPSIAATLDGGQRQFFSARGLPVRRVSLP